MTNYGKSPCLMGLSTYINYFYGHFPVRKLLVIEATPSDLERRSVSSHLKPSQAMSSPHGERHPPGRRGSTKRPGNAPQGRALPHQFHPFPQGRRCSAPPHHRRWVGSWEANVGSRPCRFWPWSRSTKKVDFKIVIERNAVHSHNALTQSCQV